MKTFSKTIIFSFFLFVADAVSAQRIMEDLDRGLVAVHTGDNKVYLGWRLFAPDDDNLSFNVYRITDNKTKKLNDKPVTTSTNFIDEHPDLSKQNSYFIKPVFNGKELQQNKSFILAANSA